METNVMRTEEFKVKVIGCSSPATISRIAEEKGINHQEVFVRAIVELDNGVQVSVSQKLRILTKSGYEKLVKAKNDEEIIDMSITDTGYFYLSKPVTIDDLFKDDTSASRIQSNLDKLQSLF